MKFFLLTLTLFLFGCGGDDFRKIEKLDGFRLLAIHTSQPEVAAGATVTLRVFASDTLGPDGGRVILGQVETCIDPGVAQGAEINCDHDPNRLSSAYNIDTTSADFQNNLGTGFGPDLNVTVPATILAGRTPRQQHNGVGYLAIFDFTVDGQQVSAFKRILASQRPSKNSNPSGSAILLNGAAFSGRPQKGDELSLTTSAPESYSFINVDGSTETRIEDQNVAWYISEAELDKSKVNVGEEVEITEATPATAFLILGIVRDDRGGVDVVRVKVP